MPVFLLRSPLPFPLQIRINGDKTGLPKDCMAPAPPTPGIPIPYPTTDMPVQVKMPDGRWSGEFILKWKLGAIAPVPSG